MNNNVAEFSPLIRIISGENNKYDVLASGSFISTDNCNPTLVLTILVTWFDNKMTDELTIKISDF